MDWRERIETDAKVLLGRLVVKGTRIPVAMVLELLASGATEEFILRNIPG